MIRSNKINRNRKLRLGPLQQSIIRRSAYLTGVTGPALLLNLALLYLAARFLSENSFGVFYLGVALVNILFAPSVVLALFYSRHLVVTVASKGKDEAAYAAYVLWRKVASWGLLGSLFVLVVLQVAGELIQNHSFLLLLLVVATTYFSYVAQVGRIALQGLQRFFWLGWYQSGWLAMRFLLGLGGLVAYGRAWAGLAGISLAAVLFSLLSLGWLRRRAKSAFNRPAPQLPGVIDLVPLAISYSAFVVLSYVDVLAGYLLFTPEVFSEYSASNILPKGILLLGMPIIQVVFPVMVKNEARKQSGPLELGKGLVAVLAVTGGTSAAILLVGDLICGGEAIGIPYCRSDLLTPLLGAMVSASALHVLVAYHMAMGKDWFPTWLLASLPGFAYIAWSAGGEPDLLARAFLKFLVVVTLIYGLILLVRLRRAPQHPAMAHTTLD